MATAGARPKAPHLKMVKDGAGILNPIDDMARTVPADYDNKLEPPVKLKGRQKELWDGTIRKASWLTKFEVPRAYCWVVMQFEFESSVVSDGSGLDGFAMMNASRISQLRNLGSELGLDPTSRIRMGIKPTAKQKQNPAEEFFAD